MSTFGHVKAWRPISTKPLHKFTIVLCLLDHLGTDIKLYQNGNHSLSKYHIQKAMAIAMTVAFCELEHRFPVYLAHFVLMGAIGLTILR